MSDFSRTYAFYFFLPVELVSVNFDAVLILYTFASSMPKNLKKKFKFQAAFIFFSNLSDQFI